MSSLLSDQTVGYAKGIYLAETKNPGPMNGVILGPGFCFIV